MTLDRNQVYETLMMIDTSLELIIKRAKRIKEDSTDKYIYHTVLKKNCHKNATDILKMARSIEHRKEPMLQLIEKQRQSSKKD